MKKGFTLIELLAVVAILAVIAITAGVSFTKISEEHQKNACNAFIEQVKNAAIEYYQDRPSELHGINNCKNVTLWYMINDTDSVDAHGTKAIAILDYTPKEVEKITKKSYNSVKNLKTCIKKDTNGNYLVDSSSTINNLCK